MEIMIFFLKIVIMGIIGHYLLKIFDKVKKEECMLISPFYTLFSILAVTIGDTNIIWIFITGIVWGSFVNIYLKSCTKNLGTRLNPIFFGIFNILNVFLINRWLEVFFENTKWNFFGYLSLFTVIAGLASLSIALRRNI